MRIAVFGSGGVGGYFGGRLAQAGEDVTFIARGEHLRAMQENGLRVDSIKGDFRIHPARATDDPRQVGVVDMVLLGVKAWQVPEAAQAMDPLIGVETGVVPLGNGVDAPAQLAEALGAGHALGGLCKISVFITGPGHIHHAGIDPVVAFGELDGRITPRVQRLRQAFERAGVNVDIADDIQVAMWEKFVFIAAISGVGAVTRAPIGKVRSLPETRRMLVGAIDEIVHLARARGIALPGDIGERTLAFIDGLPAQVTASMQRDIIDCKPSELEAQNGAVVRMAREVNVPTPINEYIYASLLLQEMDARRPA